MWDLIVSVPDNCLSFYFDCTCIHNAKKQMFALQITCIFGIFLPGISGMASIAFPKLISFIPIFQCYEIKGGFIYQSLIRDTDVQGRDV